MYLVRSSTKNDIFFNCSQGRLKLRILSDTCSELIYYERDDHKEAKQSNYVISISDEPHSLKHVLEKAYGIRGIVKKVRYLYQVGQTRIHIDEVEGLGQFMELEYVMQEGQTLEQGQEAVAHITQALQITPGDLIEGAYIDLLETT